MNKLIIYPKHWISNVPYVAHSIIFSVSFITDAKSIIQQSSSVDITRKDSINTSVVVACIMVYRSRLCRK